jgi:anti-sigma factor RsiW
VRHHSAQRRLAQLLDRTLPPALDQAVRGHAAGCGRCARRLAELELCERLVASLPLAVVPLATPHASERRLERLARWGAPAPSLRWWLGLEGCAVAAAGVLVGVIALAGVNHWVPAPEPTPSGLTQVAFVTPGRGAY